LIENFPFWFLISKTRLPTEIANDVFGIRNYAISNSIMTSIVLQWGFFAIPLIAFLIGWTGGYLFNVTVKYNRTAVSVMFYIISYNFVSAFYVDLASFMQKFFLLFVMFILLLSLSKVKLSKRNI
jgi:hypothetical protein